jgi:hypothetical protein
MFDAEEEAIRRCVRRSRPFGGETWVTDTAAALGLESSLKSSGNPTLRDDRQNIA